MRTNLAAKMAHPERLEVIPNFVDIEAITPSTRENSYRAEYGLSGKTVVMYAGNIGMSQSLSLLVDAARATKDRDDVVYVVNGAGSMLEDLQHEAAGLPNIRFVPMQPYERLPEVLAAGDIHLVPLKTGLSRSSVPSKTYSILAAGRPILASVDGGSEVQRIVEAADAGLAVPPEDPHAFIEGLTSLIDDPAGLAAMGSRARSYVEKSASPQGVARAYESVFERVRRN
jgi:colanic acid biosynthesis glycosyl transferase WcaI